MSSSGGSETTEAVSRPAALAAVFGAGVGLPLGSDSFSEPEYHRRPVSIAPSGGAAARFLESRRGTLSCIGFLGGRFGSFRRHRRERAGRGRTVPAFVLVRVTRDAKGC